MSKRVQTRDVIIGEGSPKICIPVMGRSREEIEEAADELAGSRPDLVEWRADYFEELSDHEEVKKILEMLRDKLGNTPILFTVRTSAEGGEARLSAEDYTNINLEAIKSGFADLIDVEIARGDDVAFLIVEAAHEEGILVVGSYHDFQKTPKKEDIIMKLCKMQEVETDIAKIAVMPKSERDVLTLLDATLTMKELHQETPVVTMAMGDMGRISRVAGEVFGSAITFGTAGKASAPGQIPAQALEFCMKQIGTKEFCR